jgi:hemerythrin
MPAGTRTIPHEVTVTSCAPWGALFVKWKDEYSIGIDEIDSQHKQLLRLFSMLEEQVRDGQSWSGIHYSIVEMINFARFHFQFEEALMRLYGFADYEEHCAAHRNILVKADSVLGESLQNSTRDDVALFFRDWLVHHIQGDDQSYAQHILSGAKVVRTAP